MTNDPSLLPGPTMNDTISTNYSDESFLMGDETCIERVNFFCFFRCASDCIHTHGLCEDIRTIIIEPKLKAAERKEKWFKCLVCEDNPESGCRLQEHLFEIHSIRTKYRCAKCKQWKKSFNSVCKHQRHCAVNIPDPLPRKRRFLPSANRPSLEDGLRRDIMNISDDDLRDAASNVFDGSPTWDQLLGHFVRIVGKGRRRGEGRPRVSPQQPATDLEDGPPNGGLKKLWSDLVKGNINPNLDVEEAYAHFNSHMGTWSDSNLVPIQVNAPETISIREYIDTEDIMHHLLGKSKSCPGLDKIAAVDLLPHIDIFRTVLNLCLWTGTIPPDWRQSTTTLIPKKASTLPSDYRPITVGPMAYRIFTAILARRLQDRLEPHCCQKGFLKQDGVHEAITTCRFLSSRKCVIASIDVAKAFDMVSQKAILDICAANGLTRADVLLLKNLYADCSTSLKINGQLSPKIWMKRGVKQGDPLSPILFNLVIDQLLRTLERADLGFHLGGRRLSCLAFADDLLLIGSNSREVEELARVAIEFYSSVGLSINTAKTMVMGPDPIQINQSTIQPVTSFRYLGAYIDPSGNSRYKAGKVAYKLHLITNANLSPGTKLRLIREHLLPELLHRLIHEKSLASTLADIDKRVRAAIKRIFGLSDKTPNSFFYLSRKQGGLALTQLRFDVPRMAVRRMVRLASSNSWFVRALSDEKWFRTELRRIAQLSPVDCNNQKRLLNDIRKFNDGHMCFLVGGQLANQHLSGSSGLVPEKLKKLVQLRSGMMVAREEWCQHCNEPRTMKHMLNECVLTRCQQKRRHDRILNTIEAHIKHRFPSFRVYRELYIPPSDHPMEGTDTQKYPDLVLVDPQNGTAWCYDVGVSYEDWAYSLDNYDQRKRNKYNIIADRIIEKLQIKGNHHINALVCHGLIFGSRASIHNVCLNILRDNFGMDNRSLGNILIKCAMDSHAIIKGNLSDESAIT